MNRDSTRLFVVPALSGIAFILMGALFAGSAQTPPPQDSQAAPPQTQIFTANQLTDLVAPVALYPDGLLSQVLVASTYPLEVVEAQQWLEHNATLHGAQLTEAAKQQPWDPSVQALVAFPDVLKLLNQDIRWTTDLGNAFLAQQADVMAAVQKLRVSAQANGHLTSTPQQTVTTETQGVNPAIVIQPANPDVVYAPTYDPAYIWGAPAWGSYPSLYYPTYGFGWGPGIDLGFWGGWGGWGWFPNWFGGTVFVNNIFINRHGFHRGADQRGNRERWAHNPGHRRGVPYPTQQLARRFQAASTASRANQGGFGIPNPVNLPNSGMNAFQGARPNMNRPALPGSAQGFHNMSPRASPQAGATRSSPSLPNANRPALPGSAQGFHNMSPRASPQGGAARSFPSPPNANRLAMPGNAQGFQGTSPRVSPLRSFPAPQRTPMMPVPHNNPNFGWGGHGFSGGGFGGHGGFGGGHGFSGGGFGGHGGFRGGGHGGGHR